MPGDYYGDADRREDDPYDEGDEYSDSFFLAPGASYAWPAAWFGSESADTRDAADGTVDDYPEAETGYGYDEDEGTWLDEGLVTLLILAGTALFVFPEPATSGLGIALISLGVLFWFVDVVTAET